MKITTSIAIALGLMTHVASAGTEKQHSATWTDPLTGMNFVRVAAGCFSMGRDDRLQPREGRVWHHLRYSGALSDDEAPVHEVCLDTFWLAQHEVSANTWKAIMESSPAYGSGDAPAGGVSWQDAQQFAQRLSAMAATSGSRYRLPTEAEWEYACRAGNQQDSPPEMTAWYDARKQYSGYPMKRGPDEPNSWGLHDMTGSVWEWVEDSYAPEAYRQHSLFNPVIRIETQQARVIRGGSYRSAYLEHRCANRGHYVADQALPQIGLRLVRVPAQ